MYFACVTAFHKDCGTRALLRLQQVLVNGAKGQEGREGQPLGASELVREDDGLDATNTQRTLHTPIRRHTRKRYREAIIRAR